MRFVALPLEGAFLLEREPFRDHRGVFDRTFDAPAMAAHGLETAVAQSALSTNHRRGTLRGLHLQLPPATEAKTVLCLTGAIYDVIVDARPGSPTYGRHHGLMLAEADDRVLYVPPGFLHGYQSLTDGSVVHYTMSAPYTPALARGVRWDDPDLGIPWPLEQPVLSERDAALPSFREFTAA
jgi:dTDP-4-dehydrorhamnose 3,5-epimerase